jgi:hypothetical protein
MKVFISWSGTTSHQVAVVLREWLPSVIQIVEPYVSSEDIDKGTRWSTDIAGELHASAYGIICLTKDNVLAPWINFEAGALGKSVDKSRVSPFLVGLKRSEISGPILQFQSTLVEKADVLKLLKSINTACEKDCLTDMRLEKTFEVWWPKLEASLLDIAAKIPAHASPAPPKEESTPSKVLEELLDLTRNNHRILRDPATLLPPEYLESVFGRRSRSEDMRMMPPSLGALRELERSRDIAWHHLKQMEGEMDEPNPALLGAIDAIERMEAPLRHLVRTRANFPTNSSASSASTAAVRRFFAPDK